MSLTLTEICTKEIEKELPEGEKVNRRVSIRRAKGRGHLKEKRLANRLKKNRARKAESKAVC